MASRDNSYFINKQSNLYHQTMLDYLSGFDNRKKREDAVHQLKLKANSIGKVKGYIVYILLDPRKVGPDFNFQKFIDSIIYIGRGAGDRSLHHWATLLKARDSFRDTKKYDYLLMLNSIGEGYIPLVYDFTVTEFEAITIEHSLIEVLNKENLLNSINGSEYVWHANYKELNSLIALNTLIELFDQIKRDGSPKQKKFTDLREVSVKKLVLKDLRSSMTQQEINMVFGNRNNVLDSSIDSANSSSDDS